MTGLEVSRPQRVVDAHCHVPSSEFVPASFVNSTIDNVVLSIGRGGEAARRLARGLSERLLGDRYCDQLVAELDAAGVDRAVLIVPDLTFALPDCPLSIAEQLKAVAEIRDRHPGRFEAFAGVDPRWGDDGLALFERALGEWGFCGMKVYPPCGFRPDDRCLYPYYEICAGRGAPAMVHLGGTSHHLEFEHARPLHVDQAARDFPAVPFLLAHAGTTYPEESAMMAAFRPNVFLEVSGFQAHYSAPLGQLTGKGIGHKLIFGSDWPVFGLHASLADTLNGLLDPEGPLAILRRRDVDLFFGGTIERLLAEAAPLQAVEAEERLR
jgi:predicted TIM-barrel fold metal-dependent hydrolase